MNAKRQRSLPTVTAALAAGPPPRATSPFCCVPEYLMKAVRATLARAWHRIPVDERPGFQALRLVSPSVKLLTMHSAAAWFPVVIVARAAGIAHA